MPSAPTPVPDAQRLTAVLDAVLGWSAAQDWRGWSKHDGLNSPLLRTLLGWGAWPRLLAIQAVMRAPLNVRPLLGVPRTYNPKGLALFVQSMLDRHRLDPQGGHLERARALLVLLREQRSPGQWHGACWGYPYPWQDPGFYAPAGMPNAVVTAFVCEALLDAFEVTGEAHYLDEVDSAAGFFLHDLSVLHDTPTELCLGYMPVPMRMRVMDVSILISSVLARRARLAGDERHLAQAERLTRYVVARQTGEGAWFYTDPPGDSHITHDNYHTGFILDALQRYMDSSADRQWQEAYQRGLDFYAARLFNADGAPRWMHDVDHPHDIHGAAQGILTFSRHRREYPGLATRIAAWSLRHMYHPSGRFYYQQRRHHMRRFTLLRWCNAWMCRALARLACTLAAPDAATGAP